MYQFWILKDIIMSVSYMLTYCDHRQELTALSMLFRAKSSVQSGSSIDASEMDPQRDTSYLSTSYFIEQLQSLNVSLNWAK